MPTLNEIAHCIAAEELPTPPSEEGELIEAKLRKKAERLRKLRVPMFSRLAGKYMTAGGALGLAAAGALASRAGEHFKIPMMPVMITGSMAGSAAGLLAAIPSYLRKKYKAQKSGKPYVFVSPIGALVSPEKLRLAKEKAKAARKEMRSKKGLRRLVAAPFAVLILSGFLKTVVLNLYYAFYIADYAIRETVSSIEIGQMKRAAADAAGGQDSKNMRRLNEILDRAVDASLGLNDLEREANKTKRHAEDFIRASEREGDMDRKKKWVEELKQATQVLQDLNKNKAKWTDIGRKAAVLQQKLKA